MMYPKSMQPTHARWEQIDDNKIASERALTNGHRGDDEPDTMFTPVPPIVSRNRLVVDTVYESAPASHLGIPGPDGDIFDIGFNGLSNVSDEIKAELPPECLQAFEEALAKEEEWKSRWGAEAEFAHRRAPAIDKGVV